MTVYEFLDILYDSPRKWEIGAKGMIAFENHVTCPWTYVSNVTGTRAVPFLKLVAPAADNLPGHNPTVRKALLDACGLNEYERWRLK